MNSEYYWYIGYKNDIRRTKYHHISNFADNQVTATRKEIGNCFESLEEAERAVEKLKAWKRLKKAGFKMAGCFDIDEIDEPDNKEVLVMTNGYIDYINDDIVADLEIIFGGEE